jgi:hypothetical protein
LAAAAGISWDLQTIAIGVEEVDALGEHVIGRELDVDAARLEPIVQLSRLLLAQKASPIGRDEVAELAQSSQCSATSRMIAASIVSLSTLPPRCRSPGKASAQST